MKSLKKDNAFLEILDEKELQEVQGGDFLPRFKLWGPFPWGSVLPAWAIHRASKSKGSTGGYPTTWGYRR